VISHLEINFFRKDFKGLNDKERMDKYFNYEQNLIGKKEKPTKE